jgi:uncharacterized protein YsxB (DUF464 family)
MIEVARKENGISIKGHAHYAEPGKDIVCAGVSTLAHTLVWSLEGLTNDVVNSVATKGNLEIKYRNLSEKGRILVDSFFVGVSLIAHEYPDYVKIV